MSATLNVGNFPWTERWVYSDQLNEIPKPPGQYELQQKLGTAPFRGAESLRNSVNPRELLELPLPERPRRYLDGKFPRYTSTYGGEYREPKRNQVDQETNNTLITTLPVAGSQFPSSVRRGHLVPRGPKRVLPNLRTSSDVSLNSPVRPEQQSFSLWGRLNPSHCVFPYETESQSSYSLSSSVLSSDSFPLSRDYFVKVQRKDFVEAQQKAKSIDANGVHNNKNLKPFSHSK
jgi:hypothetical protein